MSPRAQAIVQRALWLALLAALTLPQLCFWQDATDPFAPVELALIKVLLPLSLLPLLALAGLDWRAQLRRWPVRLLLAWVAWLWACAAWPQAGAGGPKTALEYSLYAAAFLLGPALDAPRRRKALAAFTAASLIAALYALFQHFGADPWHWSTDFGGRPLGTIGNPDFFAGHLVLAWSLCLGWCLSAPAGKRRLPAVALGLLTWAQAYSRVAGAWLGMLAALGLALAFILLPAGAWLRARWGLRRRRLALALAGALLLAGMACALPPAQHAWQRFRQEKQLSVVNRGMMWRVALGLWRQHPVQGAGLDSYRPLYPKLQSEILAAEPQAGWNYVVTWLPHQDYLYLLAETGLIGLLLTLGLGLLSAGAAWRRAAQGDGQALALLLALAGVAGISLLNTFSNIPPTALGFYLLAGFAAGAPGPRPLAPPRLGLEPLVAGLALALLLGVPAGRELAANRYTREAGRAEKRGDLALAAGLNQQAVRLGVQRQTPQSLVGVQFALAEDLRQLGRLPDAIAAYQADLREDPWAPEVHNMLGASLGQLGAATGNAPWLEQSAEHLQTAATLSPGYVSALLNLGGTRMLLGDKAGAASAWQELLRYEPGNAQARAYLAGLGRR
jgi:O-antigen ligase